MTTLSASSVVADIAPVSDIALVRGVPGAGYEAAGEEQEEQIFVVLSIIRVFVAFLAH